MSTEGAKVNVSAEDLALLQQVKEAMKSSDPVSLKKVAHRLGWDDKAADQNLEKHALEYEATQAAQFGMSVEQYRHARMMEEQQRAYQQQVHPQFQQQPQPQQQWQAPLANQQTPPWGAPPVQQQQNTGLPNAETRQALKAVNALKAEQEKKLKQIEYQLAQNKYEKDMADYRGYIGNVYNGMKDKLQGLSSEDEDNIVNATITGLQQAVQAGKKYVKAEQVLANMNNVYVERVNKLLEKQHGNSDKNLPLYEFPKEEQVPTLNAQSTGQGAVGIGKDQKEVKPAQKLAPADSMAAGQPIIEEEITKTPVDSADGAIDTSTLPAVRAAVEKEEALERAVDDVPIGQVNADGVSNDSITASA